MSLEFFYPLHTTTGEQLDAVGQAFDIERDGKSDAEFRKKLLAANNTPREPSKPPVGTLSRVIVEVQAVAPGDVVVINKIPRPSGTGVEWEGLPGTILLVYAGDAPVEKVVEAIDLVRPMAVRIDVVSDRSLVIEKKQMR